MKETARSAAFSRAQPPKRERTSISESGPGTASGRVRRTDSGTAATR